MSIWQLSIYGLALIGAGTLAACFGVACWMLRGIWRKVKIAEAARATSEAARELDDVRALVRDEAIREQRIREVVEGLKPTSVAVVPPSRII